MPRQSSLDCFESLSRHVRFSRRSRRSVIRTILFLSKCAEEALGQSTQLKWLRINLKCRSVSKYLVWINCWPLSQQTCLLTPWIIFHSIYNRFAWSTKEFGTKIVLKKCRRNFGAVYLFVIASWLQTLFRPLRASTNSQE